MKTLYESILDDENELINRKKDTFKNWVAFISCMYFEKKWSDDEILEYLNSKYVMSFFPSLKNYKWDLFVKSNRMADYVLLDSKSINKSISVKLKSTTVKLELVTLKNVENKVELQIGCNYFEGGELAKLKRRLEGDCKMKFTHTSNDFGGMTVHYAPKNEDYWKDFDNFK